MKEGATAGGRRSRASTLQTFAGKQDGDNEAQVQAIENLISAGAKGFLITPSDSKAIVPSHRQGQAGRACWSSPWTRPTDPPDAADATFATDNYQAGTLIGQWAKAKFGNERQAGQDRACWTSTPTRSRSTSSATRASWRASASTSATRRKIGDESDPRIVGHDVTDGAEDGGRTAMENLLQKDPAINLVYTINEPAAAGAYQALKAAGKEKDVTIVSVDGGCPGVDSVKAGQIGATSQQFPLKMASQGVEAVVEVRQGRHQAAGDRGQDVHRHRRHADHRPGRRPGSSPRTPPGASRTAGADGAPSDGRAPAAGQTLPG